MNVRSQFWSDLEGGEHTLSLVHTKLATSGRYRCQITEAQAPFHTEQQDRNLSVISKLSSQQGYQHVQTNSNQVSEFLFT